MDAAGLGFGFLLKEYQPERHGVKKENGETVKRTLAKAESLMVYCLAGNFLMKENALDIGLRAVTAGAAGASMERWYLMM